MSLGTHKGEAYNESGMYITSPSFFYDSVLRIWQSNMDYNITAILYSHESEEGVIRKI